MGFRLLLLAGTDLFWGQNLCTKNGELVLGLQLLLLYKIKLSQGLPGPVLQQAISHLGCALITWDKWFTFLSPLSAQWKCSTTGADWEEMPWLLQTLRSNGKSKNPAVCVWSCAENMANSYPAPVIQKLFAKDFNVNKTCEQLRALWGVRASTGRGMVRVQKN